MKRRPSSRSPLARDSLALLLTDSSFNTCAVVSRCCCDCSIIRFEVCRQSSLRLSANLRERVYLCTSWALPKQIGFSRKNVAARHPTSTTTMSTDDRTSGQCCESASLRRTMWTRDRAFWVRRTFQASSLLHGKLWREVASATPGKKRSWVEILGWHKSVHAQVWGVQLADTATPAMAGRCQVGWGHLAADMAQCGLDVYQVSSPHGIQHQWQACFFQPRPLCCHLPISLCHLRH